MRFPPGFRFGMATSAYQIEGAADAGGKAPSIWDTFTAQPGRVRHGEDGRVAIDHYHRYAEDVGHIADAGVHDYRFSISWTRALADPGFYDRLVDELLAAGVRPVPTLYHWDLPQDLEDRGGWLTRDTAHRLADYAGTVALRLGDRVRHWITMNEMSVQTLYGYGLTSHAPGRGLGLEALPVAHHQLLAHGLAVQVLRAHDAGAVGIANQHFPVYAASDDPADAVAADMFRDLTNWTFSDPILLGDYPDEMIRAGVGVEETQLDRDLALIGAPLDFYGVNFYEPTAIEAPREGKDYSGILEVDIPEGMPFSPVPVKSDERTDFGWAIVPAALTEILVTLKERYPLLPPVIVTENGASFHDGPPGEDGRVGDPRRIAYLQAHLEAVAAAIEAGAPVQGYYVWSAFDNFEWAAGYDERFGLVYVDRETQARTRKDSWYWYRDLIRSAAAG
ncbi:beta-glucosidase [Actinoplanes sp. SE50]|uniref:GH1 family beta-glucosidase n=1 Tax=unclassified Actinoplanes TaxID=2626549 RepID=UPI00023EC6F4|nr:MULTISPECIES: GH1 family beta-glucosidase [unclassified Actinoplanes]AEV81430.1 beta-glucosidase [Actinoplanes sp. SE50/110]ATO79833.1 beta-glucosidase [Actinoplanes sp. SE50]SLL97235.1 beta-glucosidase [Actinoplanes sp. SE50/110]